MLGNFMKLLLRHQKFREIRNYFSNFIAIVIRESWSYFFKSLLLIVSYLMAAGKHFTQNRRFSSTVLKIRTEAAAVELASECS